MTDEELDLLTSTILDLGALLLRSGAEVNRVEDTIRRIAQAYGFVRVEIFTINNMMTLTVHSPKGRIITQTRRITSTKADFEKIARANALSREVCAEPIPYMELQQCVTDIEKNSCAYRTWVRYLAYVITAGAFTIFFGGELKEAAVSAITGFVLCAVVSACERLKIQPIIANLVGSFIMTLLISVLTASGTGAGFDTIVMGNIMLLIPGLGLTTSIRDMITGDTVSGLMGICDALLKAFAIAVGCVAVVLLTGMA